MVKLAQETRADSAPAAQEARTDSAGSAQEAHTDSAPTVQPDLASADPFSFEGAIAQFTPSDHDDKTGIYTAKAMAESFNTASSTLRTRWFPKLREAAGDENRLRRKGKYTELAAELFRLYAGRPEAMTSAEWVGVIAPKFDAELIELFPSEPSAALTVRTDATIGAVDFYETAAEFVDAEIDASRGRSAALLAQVREMQLQERQYTEVSHDQAIAAASEREYEKTVEIEAAKQSARLRALRDMRQPPTPAAPPSARFRES